MTGTLCPQTTLNFMPFTFTSCVSPMMDLLNFGPLSITKLQGHFMIFSLFASTIGPFGGFFASGLKRSVKIKVTNIILLGLRQLHSRARRSQRQNGLPVDHGSFRLLLLPKFHESCHHKHISVYNEFADPYRTADSVQNAQIKFGRFEYDLNTVDPSYTYIALSILSTLISLIN
jgi:hypothetical protein